ncbi:MAG: amino acid--tRNA ligase-related protein, partial [Parcubacteria group bacterium]
MKTPLPYDEQFKNVIGIVSTFFRASQKHYEEVGLQYVEVPTIVGVTGACENIDTLFTVGSRLEIPLFITQTGQLALELALQEVPGVYTVIHSGRDEEEEDNRHLRQFRLTEEEFDCTMAGMTRENYDEEKMYEALLQHIEAAVKAMIAGVLADH